MDRLEQFYGVIKKEMAVILATAAEKKVTMRTVSPVYYNGDILMFTSPDSNKYKQLKLNPNCCIAVCNFFAEATAKFMGATMLDENAALREAYSAKFPGAFDEGIEFGGRAADFILLHPTRLSGWAFENDVPTPDGVPTIPFEVEVG